MRNIFQPFFLVLLTYLTFIGCANQGTLTGGKKDTRPPVLDSSKSTPNYQTNFEKQTINLVFDEWLQLNDVFKQVVVSPPLQEKFDVSLKKKTVRFKFDEDEVLRENATYTINFGTCVQDLTEKNPVEDLRFVFSTGDFIDSLEVKGTVVDALDKKPVKDALVMLYDNLADTVVRKEKPFYFGKTDADGNFIIKNVRADTFKTFALIDGNSNYLFDNDTEKIGFINDPIIVTDSTEIALQLQIFQEEPALQLKGEEVGKYGRLAFGFSRKPLDEEVQITFNNVGQKTYLHTPKDSIILWYDVPQDTSWKVFIATDTATIDTIRIGKESRSKFLKDKKLELAKAITPASKFEVIPKKPLKIEFKHPLESFDTTLISLLVDTLLEKVTPQVEIDSMDKRILLVNHKFKEKTPYQLQLVTNAVTDLYGLKNDSISMNLDIKSKNEFGDLTLNLVDLKLDKSYVLELLDKSNNLVERIPISGDTIFKKVYQTIETGVYSVKIIQDNNSNGKWDTGNYDNKSQPEPLFTRKLEEVRAGWEVDATVSADEKNSVKKAEATPPERPESDNPKPGRPRRNR